MSSAAFLLNLHNLEGLSMRYVPFTEIFVNEENSSGEIHAVGTQLPHLKFLRLSELPMLMHLGKENSQPVIPNLKILVVNNCVRLQNLRSSAVSLQNLTTLKVIGCYGLEYLTTYSIAQSLMQLTHMEVKNCARLMEIVARNEEEAGYEIAFIRLQHLELSGLPSLKGFCSENCIVKVPSLNTLAVIDCLIELKISLDMILLSDSKPEKLIVNRGRGKRSRQTSKFKFRFSNFVKCPKQGQSIHCNLSFSILFRLLFSVGRVG
jgi:hypothetical protein